MEGVDNALAKFGEAWAPYVAELVGTYFLVLTIAMAGPGQFGVFAPFAIGFVLVVLVFTFGFVSGAHYNPAVTLAVRISGRNLITTRKALGYVFVQVVGGLLGALTGHWLFDTTFSPRPGVIATTGQAVFAEAMWTFLLATVVLHVATAERQAENSFFGLGIGLTVLSGAITVSPISGGVFNPAVGTAGILVSNFAHGYTVKYLWLYWVAPLLGGLVASFIFRITNAAEYSGEHRRQRVRNGEDDDDVDTDARYIDMERQP